MQKTHIRKDARRDWKRDKDVCGGGLSVVAQVYKRGTAGEQSQAGPHSKMHLIKHQTNKQNPQGSERWPKGIVLA